MSQSWIEVNQYGVDVHITQYSFLHNTKPKHIVMQHYERKPNDFWVDVLYEAFELSEKADLDVFDANGEPIDLQAEIIEYDINIDDIERRTWS